MPQQDVNPRLNVFNYVAAALFLVLAMSLAYTQGFKGSYYKEMEERQNGRRIVNPAPRGNIYDRNGLLLVGNRPRLSAAIYLNELRPEFRNEFSRLKAEHYEAGIPFDSPAMQKQARLNVVQSYLDRVNAITGRSETTNSADLETHFWQRPILPFPLAVDLNDIEQAQLYQQIPVDSPLQIHVDSARYYPQDSAAAHTLGYVRSSMKVPTESLPGDKLITFRFKGTEGVAGIEASYDKWLQGKSGGEIWLVDPRGVQAERVEYKPSEQGRDLHLSLDLGVQRAAERALRGKTGAIVALDVKTGEVIALASKPDFDLNDMTPYMTRKVSNDIEARGAWMNRATQGLYPPGSTFKVVTAIATLREGVVGPDTEIDCNGYYKVGDRDFPCNSIHGVGVGLEDSLCVSCNTFYYAFSLEAGADSIADTARMFGLHRRAGIEVGEATESSILIPDDAWKRQNRGRPWFLGDTANMSIGQGFLKLTPLQMAAFTASFARGETRTDVTLLKRQPDELPVDHGGQPIPIPHEEYLRVVDGMERVVHGTEAGGDRRGTGRLARIPGLRVAAKTGTAQVYADGEELNLAWFICFAPVEDPRIAVTVLVEGAEPGDVGGGKTAAPLARVVLEQYFGL